MRILAQQGYGPGEKLVGGIERGIIDGVILSPRYWKPEKMATEVARLRQTDCFLGIDPEYYATEYLSHPNPNLGSLEEWDYFRRPRRASLVTGKAIPLLISDALSAQMEFEPDYLIAPNVFVRQADSIDTAIAMNFVNATKTAASSLPGKPVFATLAFHRDALLAGEDFKELLDSLTGIDDPPDGYYIVIGSTEQQSTGRFVRSDLSHPTVIAAWMYMNYALSLNGADVINGYCFLLGPLLGICGASGAASGWSSGLRKFCIDRYARSQSGGMAPNVRYVSNSLMSHVLQTDLEAFAAINPDVLNGLDLDSIYTEGAPSRTEEALQAWQAIRSASADFETTFADIPVALETYRSRIGAAKERLEMLQIAGLTSEIEPNIERLDAMDQGISLFLQWAELA